MSSEEIEIDIIDVCKNQNEYSTLLNSVSTSICKKKLELDALDIGGDQYSVEPTNIFAFQFTIFVLILAIIVPIYNLDTFYTPGSRDEMTMVKFDKMKVLNMVNSKPSKQE
jgi:hypothetical protein